MQDTDGPLKAPVGKAILSRMSLIRKLDHEEHEDHSGITSIFE